MSRFARNAVLAALLGGALASCTEAPRAGSVYRSSIPYGTWWQYSGVYDRPLALGRPKVSVPAEPAEPRPAGAD
jgi:hypothetical protein